MLSVPQMLWPVNHARDNDSRVLLLGDSAQHRSVERGDALRILEQSGTVRYVELLQSQRQKVPALKAAIEDLKAGRFHAGWEKLEHHGVIKHAQQGTIASIGNAAWRAQVSVGARPICAKFQNRSPEMP
jgi:AAA domain